MTVFVLFLIFIIKQTAMAIVLQVCSRKLKRRCKLPKVVPWLRGEKEHGLKPIVPRRTHGPPPKRQHLYQKHLISLKIPTRCEFTEQNALFQGQVKWCFMNIQSSVMSCNLIKSYWKCPLKREFYVYGTIKAIQDSISVYTMNQGYREVNMLPWWSQL